MKIFNRLFFMGIIALAMISCKDNGNNAIPAQQQQQAVPAQQQTSASAVAQNQPAPAANVQLPEPISAFLQQYFPNATVAYVETDPQYGGMEYDVTLTDGTEIDFDRTNQWDKVDCHMNPGPAALVPPAIANYVKTNFQGAVISKLDKERQGYDVELNNGMELRFGPDGQFMGYDD